jgi:hypothetical protein
MAAQRTVSTWAVMVGLAVVGVSTGAAQTLTEYSSETRFQLDVKVPDAALAAYLPAGWTSNVSAQGPAKDCNLRVIFIDRVTINGADGRAAGKGTNQLVWLAAPAKDPAGANAQLIIGGLTVDPADAPGPFGNFIAATTHAVARSTASAATGMAPLQESQDWTLAAPSGEHFEMHIKYERGIANKGNPSDAKFYSAKTPTFFQISHQEQVLDILRNTTTNPPDRVKEFTFKGGGGSYAKLFDGTEKLLSWDNILWINRAISLP